MRVGDKRYTVIKYDCLDRRINLIAACVATIVSFGSIAFAFMPFADTVGSALFAIVTLVGAMFCPVMALICWIRFAMSTGYLRRLRAYGYEVPERRRMYRGLEELAQNRKILQRKTGNSRESIVLAVICWMIAAGCMVGVVPFYVNYQMKEIGIVFCGAAMIFWVVYGLHYFRQRSRERYRDDVEPEQDEGNARRVRTHFAEGIVTILILVFFTWMTLYILYNLCGVIFRARLLHKTDY